MNETELRAQKISKDQRPEEESCILHAERKYIDLVVHTINDVQFILHWSPFHSVKSCSCLSYLRTRPVCALSFPRYTQFDTPSALLGFSITARGWYVQTEYEFPSQPTHLICLTSKYAQ